VQNLEARSVGPGQGSEFVLHLPRAAPGEVAPTSEIGQERSGPPAVFSWSTTTPMPPTRWGKS